MEVLGLWPAFPRGATFAEKYLLINLIMLRCSRKTGVPVPLLDALWWRATNDLKKNPLEYEEDAAGLEGGVRELYFRTKSP